MSLVKLTRVAGWLTTWKSALTGAVERLLQDKLGDSVSVMDFGAVGDGITDDTSAFQVAASACPRGVYVPSGTYFIPNNIQGRFYGPGVRVTVAGSSQVIPFSNPAQTHGTTFLGFDAGKLFAGDHVTAQVVGIGPSACRNVTTGTNVTAVGSGPLTGDTLNDALTDTSPFTGTEVIALGVNACKKAVTASNIIGIGRDALNELKFGSFNVAIGSSAFQQMHTGSNNTALGRSAGMRSGIVTDSNGTRLSFNVVNGCTFIGSGAGREHTSGDNNSYFGFGAGRGVTSTTNTYTGTSTGSNNTALGTNALNSVGSASNNTVLGMNAAQSLVSGSGNIIIGNDAYKSVVEANNMFIIGNTGSLPFLQGSMGGTNNSNNFLNVDATLRPAGDGTRNLGSSSYRWSAVAAVNGVIQTSDGRHKDILSVEDAEIKVGLRLSKSIIKYRWKSGEDKAIHFGVIAQEVMLAFEEAGLDPLEYGVVTYDTDADIFGVNYAELNALCIAALAARAQ